MEQDIWFFLLYLELFHMSIGWRGVSEVSQQRQSQLRWRWRGGLRHTVVVFWPQACIFGAFHISKGCLLSRRLIYIIGVYFQLAGRILKERRYGENINDLERWGTSRRRTPHTADNKELIRRSCHRRRRIIVVVVFVKKIEGHRGEAPSWIIFFFLLIFDTGTSVTGWKRVFVILILIL